MSKNVWTIIAAVIVCLAGVAAADSNCHDDYIVPAEWELFSGTLSGVREAYYILDTGMQKNICAGNSELTFLHATAKTIMLCIENSDVNNFVNIANEFGVTVAGDYFDELKVNVFKSGGCYEIPAWAPDANEVSQRIQSSIIPEINDIIAELNSISDSPTDRFEIFLEPNETGLDKTVIVDYGEVLILKGTLAALKSQLEFRQAYNLAIDINDPKVEELINSTFCGEEPSVNFNINEDFLERYANLLNVLPDGNAVLAQTKQDLITAIDYYFTCINYIISEANDQHLLYIDPNDVAETLFLDAVNSRLGTFRDSLKNDTVATYPLETTKTYNIYDSNSTYMGQLIFSYQLPGSDFDGEFTFTGGGVPSPWNAWLSWEGTSGIEADVECRQGGEWTEGYFHATLSNDGNSFSDGTFEYWDFYNGTITGLSGHLVSTSVSNIRIDLNPIFGNNGETGCRYPNPVNPRDLLPAFDADNGPISCTFGHGLNNDATLGGILPDMNQQDCSNIYGLSDCGNINCPSADVASAQGAGIGDCFVNIYDLAALASHWLDACTQPNWCGNVDFDRNGSIDFADFAKLADEWLQQGGP